MTDTRKWHTSNTLRLRNNDYDHAVRRSGKIGVRSVAVSAAVNVFDVDVNVILK